MKKEGIPVLRGKQSKFIFIQMKECVNQNGFKVQSITINEKGNLLKKLHGQNVFISIKPSKVKEVLVLMRLFQKYWALKKYRQV